jgi:gliding motility-associated-like protein
VNKLCPNILFVPTAFSPNGDGLNDFFKPIGYDVADLRMNVYNRWGELLFETNDIDAGWDGSYKATACEVGTYVWWVSYKIGTASATKL